MGPRRMKAATEGMSGKEIGRFKACRVFIIFLPPHSSHKIQTLGYSVHWTPKTFYDQESEKWLR
jgi:hypothetical protein